MEWKTIDTAPKDGSWFVAYRPIAQMGKWDRAVIVRWSDDLNDFIWPNEIYDIFSGPSLDALDEDDFLPDVYEACGSFTHWMPLPAPPNPAMQPKHQGQE